MQSVLSEISLPFYEWHRKNNVLVNGRPWSTDLISVAILDEREPIIAFEFESLTVATLFALTFSDLITATQRGTNEDENCDHR